jgi:hypothetical protein
MKKHLLYLILLLSANSIYAQEINYQKNYRDALSLADKSNKPLFIMITPPVDPPAQYANYNSINSKTVTDFYNKKFISYRARLNDTSIAALRNQFKLTIFPAYLFLDARGQIVFKTGGNYTAPEKYLEIAKQALTRIESGKTITGFEKLDKENKLTREQLKEYILLKEDLELFNNAALADKYIRFLTIAELDNYDEILFVLKTGPYAYGTAYNLLYTNRKIVDSVYKREPLELRKAINNRIITNTRAEAIKSKNANMAQNVASFTSSTWGTNYLEAQRSSISEMLYYYKTVKDTAKYYPQAAYYYDRFYLSVSVDSAKKLQAKALETMREATKANITRINALGNPRVNNSGRFTGVTVTPANYDVANTLNNAAYDFYTLGTHNIQNLVKAMIWSKRAIELQPIAGYYDTFAHIMYRMNLYEEAVLNQAKAVELAAAQPTQLSNLEHLQAELAKMKERKL